MQAAFDAGVNFFDTADVYGAGRAEEVLGLALRPLPRRQVVIATKCYFRFWPGPLGYGLSRKHIVESVEGSLRRLGVEYIDLLQTHYPDKDTPVDVTLRAMDDLIRQGKILYAACSNYTAAELAEAILAAERLGITRFESTQPEYSMLFRHVETEDLPFCATGSGWSATARWLRGCSPESTGRSGNCRRGAGWRESNGSART